MDCFAEPVIGRRFAPTRWLAMTEVAQPIIPPRLPFHAVGYEFLPLLNALAPNNRQDKQDPGETHEPDRDHRAE
ncbi:hypothetical protein UP10_06485 [Bradyrhizobium sp. LTSPM299]|jgi:hypothetical protein|nr:hypothetical protein UP10_06485 [Bradyrhizobium sp. LTSPM299]